MKHFARVALVGSAMLGIIGAATNAAAEPPPACTTPKTTCAGHGGYYASTEDVDRVTAVADPILREVRACLDGVGAKQVASVLVIRWDSDGKPVDVKIDVPGYEGMACVKKAQAKLSALQNPRETAIRCEYGCPQPVAAKPAATPVVVPPPAAKEAPAPAQQPAAPAPPPKAEQPPREEKVWYGYQTLTVDGLSFAGMIGGVAGHSWQAFLGGYGAFLLGTPIVHMVHGNIGPGFGSIGLRLLLPLVGTGVGAIAGLIVGGSQGSGAFDQIGNGANGAITGAVVGALGTGAICVLIDAAGFAYTKERVDANSLAQPLKIGSVTPTLSLRSDYVGAGLGGQF